MQWDVDVVVIGAGVAGIAAAQVLQEAGVSFRVLEARDRIGGRAITCASGLTEPFDIGCDWIHAADRNPFFPEAQAADAALYRHEPKIDQLWLGHRPAGSAATERLRAAQAVISEAMLRPFGAVPSGRLTKVIADGHMLRAHATYAGPMDFSPGGDDITMDDYHAAAELAPSYITRQGYAALIAKWGAAIPVTLSTPVTRLRWDGHGVQAETPFGALSARAAVVTVSPGVLQWNGLSFHPALPDAHLEAIFDLEMALLTRIPLQIKGTRLDLAPFADILIERRGRRDVYFLAFPFDADLVIGFVGGAFAWELEAAGSKAAVDFVTARLVDALGSSVRRYVGQAAMTEWGSDKWSHGAYAAARPGRIWARAVLSEPVAEKIWFAGEALAGSMMQTAGGARLSGASVGAEVLRALAQRGQSPLR